MSTNHDVVIVGGGLVGASLAIALQRIGVDCALVEATAAGAPPAVFDQRNLSFAAATVNALTALGVMARLRSATGPIRRIHVSRAGDFGRVTLDAADYDRPWFGQVVVARDFGLALEARLAELPALARYRPARFVRLGAVVDGRRPVVIAGDNGEQTLNARLVVGCDGTASSVRQAVGIGTLEQDYLQTLFVARARAERGPDGTAWERFTDSGPTALLPRGDRHYGLIHTVPRADAAAVAALDDAAFLARAQAAIGWRAGRLLEVGPRSAYPLARVLARELVAERVVLMGNAAQTIHPIGAQGFNLGLRDALTLAELIEHDRNDPGSAGQLAAYVARRGPDREQTLAFSDGLARFTGNERPAARGLRSLGLLAASASGSLKATLVGGAMGFRGEVPALCREDAA
ncbi:2-octaprenyl-6-methoxyphenyl hydroxylase [Stenotrophomonas sp. W1S232]|uniref:2-octaprenyl-6-methoxyphenyl hydroxylase n=1 Tax=Stenotrophomonas koreensis TaxID=266128 RepID=A0A7W3UX72_9GAMM|nr:2-octaprenyl-6-methoxyphenyl hydroxylase [Stenotrophomonas koreensis]MBB1115498.1 2-octaprenyl-6-methoxyphenyl hydroxylase [Stenotrophomonas koreensis]